MLTGAERGVLILLTEGGLPSLASEDVEVEIRRREKWQRQDYHRSERRGKGKGLYPSKRPSSFPLREGQRVPGSALSSP